MMAPDRPGIALLGCGQWGRNLAKLGVLRTVCDQDPSALEHVQELSGVELVSNAEVVFEDPRITACVIAAQQSSIALPLHSGLSKTMVQRVCAELKRLLSV